MQNCWGESSYLDGEQKEVGQETGPTAFYSRPERSSHRIFSRHRSSKTFEKKKKFN